MYRKSKCLNLFSWQGFLILGGDEQQMTGNFYKVKRWPGDGKIICSKCKKHIINSSRKRYKDAQIYMREFGIQPPKKESSPWTEEDFEEHNGLPQNCTWYGLHNSRIELIEKKEKKPKNEPE